MGQQGLMQHALSVYTNNLSKQNYYSSYDYTTDSADTL